MKAAAPFGSDGGYYMPDASQQHQLADLYAGYDPADLAGIPPELLAGATNLERREGRVVSERLVEERHQVVVGVPREMFNSREARDVEAVRTVIDRVNEGGVAVAGLRPIYMMEKIVEVPHVITQEYDRHVPKPELIERLIEVPKTEIQRRTVNLPPQIQYEERIKEVLQVVEEERIIHVPKRVVEERLIEVPRVKFVERIEYEDFIEYREVPVDKIVEVPEIEYRVREVEQLVPQTYIQEYYVDRYVEVPVTQIQEVERIEHVPVEVPQGCGAPAMVVQVPTQPLPPRAPAPQQFGAAPAPLASLPTLQQAPYTYTADGPPTPPVPPTYGDAGLQSARSQGALSVGSSFLVPRGTFRPPPPGVLASAPPGALPLPTGIPQGTMPSAMPGTNPFQSYPMGAYAGSQPAYSASQPATWQASQGYQVPLPPSHMASAFNPFDSGFTGQGGPQQLRPPPPMSSAAMVAASGPFPGGYPSYAFAHQQQAAGVP